jgi:phospholipid/cholesterol/gamma-HCH transport system substrate-binding protein
MERNAHYAMVGLISILLVAGLGAFMVWLAGAQFAQRFDVYDVAFKGPVRGLSTGGEVFFNGIRIGEVTKLSLDRTDPNKVQARIRVTSEAPVRVDSRAGLEPQGVTGVNYIQISAGSLKYPLLKDVTPEDKIPVILASPSALESLLQGGGDVLTRAVEVLDRTNRLLSEENIAAFGGVLQDVHAVTNHLRHQDQLLVDLDRTVNSVNQTSERIAAVAASSSKLVDGDGKRALANLADAAAELKSTATDARAMIAALKGPASNFATTGLPQFNRTVSSLETAADSISRLTSQLELNPSGVLSKPPAATLQVKP